MDMMTGIITTKMRSKTVNYNNVRLSKRNRKLVEKYEHKVEIEDLLNALAKYSEVLAYYEELDIASCKMYAYYHKMWKIHDDALYKALKTHRPRYVSRVRYGKSDDGQE